MHIRCFHGLLLLLTIAISAAVKTFSVAELHAKDKAWIASVAEHHAQELPAKIPRQLILTGKPDKVDDLPAPVLANLKRTLKLNPEFKASYYSDKACHDFIKENQEQLGLLQAFESERRGSYRGDLCRSAVLAVEGGFYQDLDVELVKPYRDLVSKSTSFMSALSAGNEMSILNALIATEPNNDIMRHTVEAQKDWYNGGAKAIKAKNGWMGPTTMMLGIGNFMKGSCPKQNLTSAVENLEWSCGPQNVRLYQENSLQCSANILSARSRGCSKNRKEAKFEGLKYGLYEPGPSGAFIGWPRFAGCKGFGCNTGGWDVAPLL